jgi:hypothetical protein
MRFVRGHISQIVRFVLLPSFPGVLSSFHFHFSLFTSVFGSLFLSVFDRSTAAGCGNSSVDEAEDRWKNPKRISEAAFKVAKEEIRRSPYVMFDSLVLVLRTASFVN